MTKDGFFRKHEYVYDEFYDCYLCPNDKILRYSTTNREGYKEYKSDCKVCEKCAFKNKCTESKNSTKVVTRHVWENYLEQTEDIRHTLGIKEIYALRSQTIERVFADAKELHGMRYTQYRGLAKVKMELTLKFACMNLKKLAIWKWRNESGSPFFAFSSRKMSDFLKKFDFRKEKTTIEKYSLVACLQSERVSQI